MSVAECEISVERYERNSGSNDLAGKDIIITGGARGIGRAIARLCLVEGGNVVIADMDATTGVETVKAFQNDKLHNIDFVQMNVADEESVDRGMDAAIDILGGHVRGLVTSAGITRDKSIRGMTKKMFDDVLDVNLGGTFNCVKKCIEPMIADGGGSIVGISSVARWGNRGQANYSASKNGLLGLFDAMSQELAGKGVRSNLVAPGFVEGPMTDLMDPETLAKFKEKVPQKRLIQPEEIAEAVVWLLGSKSSAASGAVLDMNGGLQRLGL